MKRVKAIYPTFFGVLLLLCWYALRYWGEQWDPRAFNRFVLPYPHEILSAYAEVGPHLLRGAWFTFMTAFLGFLGAGAGGFLGALPLAMFPVLRHMLYPWATALQMIPIIVLAPIFMIWFGEGLRSVFMVAFTMGFFPVFASTVQGVHSVDTQAKELFRLYGANRRQTLFYLQIPHAWPYTLTGMQIAATLAVIGALTGELFAGSAAGGRGGLGFMVIIFKSQGKIPELFATALTACLLGFAFVGLVATLRKWILQRWHPSASLKGNEKGLS